MPHILNEDAAILAKLSGIQVSTPGGLLDVPVRWIKPEPERGEMTYPVIVLSQPTIHRATDREARGFTRYDYIQEGKAMPGPDDRWGYYGERPIPFNLDYRVTVKCRIQEHQSELIGKMARGDILPARGGYLTIPALDVVVSLDVLGGPERDSDFDSNGKRSLNTQYLIRVYTELSPYDVERYEAVETVSGTISDFDFRSERPGRVLSEWRNAANDL